MSNDPMQKLRDIIERKAMAARGIPWHGRKQLGSYAYYPAVVQGVHRLLRGRAYDASGNGWRVLNKPQSRRARHKLAVAALKAGKAQ